MHKALVVAVSVLLAGCTGDEVAGIMNFAADRGGDTPRITTPEAAFASPAMRWDHRPEASDWTQSTLAAVLRDGGQLLASEPEDVQGFCPAYAGAGEAQRAAFWVGLMSALAKHESTWNPQASGGGGKWIGLLQIAPSTWRYYGCTGNIRDGADNLACSVKIMDRQVGRDQAIVKTAGAGGWRGVARDWAPMRKASKVADMKAWTSKQEYCRVQ